MVGGYLFGVFYGAVFSIIGLTLMCINFYIIAEKFPGFLTTFASINKRMLKSGPLTRNEVFILRMVPFVHFHLLSLYVMEQTKSFKEYTTHSFLGVIFPAIIFTSFGQMIIDLPLFYSCLLLLFLVGLFFGVRRKGLSKQTTLEWNEFFIR